MSFRAKVKKAFGSGSKESPRADGKDPKVPQYKPGEVPPSKYRGKWDQQHQDALQAFSFASAFGRRKSSHGQSDYSPMASRRQSTATSGRKSTQRNREPSHIGQTVEDARGGDDPAIVGRSRPGSADEDRPTPVTEEGDGTPLEQQETVTELKPQETITNGNVSHAQRDKPLDEEELAKALTATKVKDEA